MRTTYRIAIFWMVAAASPLVCVADTFTTLDGTRYTNVKVTGHAPDSISVMTDDGVTRIPYENLPPEILRAYGINAGAAAAYRSTLAEAATADAQAKSVALEKEQVAQQDQELEQKASLEKQKEFEEQPHQVAKRKVKDLLDERYTVRLALDKKLDDILSREGDIGPAPTPPNGDGIAPPGGTGLLNRVSPMDIQTRSELLDLISACKREEIHFLSCIPDIAKQMAPADVTDLHKFIRNDNATFEEVVNTKMKKIEMCEKQRNSQIRAENEEADKQAQLRAQIMAQSIQDERDEKIDKLQGELDLLRTQINQNMPDFPVTH